MAITPAERRFLRSWEEQRNGGKAGYVATYTFAYTFVIYLTGIALGLFLNIPFIRFKWLVMMAIASIAGAFIISMVVWKRQQKKWRNIINRETAASN
jgi:hypothetical protein